MPKLNHRSHRVRDFLLYIAIGLAIAGLAILAGIHRLKSRDNNNNSKIIGVRPYLIGIHPDSATAC